MLFYESSGFRENFLGVTHHGGVVGMLLREFVEYCRRDLMFICKRCCVCVREIFFVKRQRRFVDRSLRLLQIRLSALHDFFHRHVRREREVQFLAKLLSAEAKIAVRARQQIVLKPFFVIG